VLESKWGLAQGFDTYSDEFDLSKYKMLSLGTVQKPGDEVADNALAWLETVRSRKFFAWVHLYDPHTPYEPPEPYRSRYANEPYLGEIAYTDKVVGRLVDWLQDRRLLEKTVVVVVGDHGESLGEHGENAHAFFIYGATTHVPLLVRTPWGFRGRSPAAVSTVDVLPTVLDLLGLPPQDGIDGHSLVRAFFDPGAALSRPAYAESYFPRYHFGWQHLRGLRDARYQFIDAPQPELYDLERDPGEVSNVYKAYSQRAEDLRQALDRLVGQEAKAAPERQNLDPETLQRLAALGYVGSVGEVDPKAVLPDPKDKLAVFRLMGAAKSAAQADRLDEAIVQMRQVLVEEPKIVDAHLTLANWLIKAKRQDEAALEFKQVLALAPDDETAMVGLAQIYRSRGQGEAALEGYRHALKLDPKSPRTWYQLATLYLDLARVGEAETAFRQALEHNPKMGAAYNSLGVIAFSRGQVAEAERLVRQGLELESKVRTGRFNLARVLEAKGALDQAEAYYRQELETYPDHGKARFNLAQLLHQRGDREGFLRELRAGVERAPEFGPCYFFLAREALTAGRIDEAADLAERGLKVDTTSAIAPLGHYVLADVYNRRGQRARSETEVAAARRVEVEARRSPTPVI
jgi:tetratricopeptide (TPR) repeat protein